MAPGPWLDLAEPACHLNAFEAQAWCAWAGRRLPSEAEWEHAALTQPEAFRWGDVWEWTQDAFAPYAGFVPPLSRLLGALVRHARVLRGGSFMTQGRMKHPTTGTSFSRAQRGAGGVSSCSLLA